MIETNPLQITLEQGLTLHQTGDFAGAQKIYGEVLSRYPEHPEANHLMGVSSLQCGDIGKAILFIRTAIQYRPVFPQAYSNLGLACYQAGEFSNAIEAFEQALELKPNWTMAVANLARVLFDTGQLDLGIEKMCLAVDLDPGSAQNRLALAELYQKTGRFQEAFVSYKAAIQIKPDDFGAHNSIANCYRVCGQHSLAIQHYEKAISLNPHFAGGYSNLGLVLWSEYRIQEAEQAFMRALEVDPNYVPAYHNLADLYEKSNRLELAEKLANKALDLAPQFHQPKRILAAILRQKGDPASALQCISDIDVSQWDADSAADHYNELGKNYDLLGDVGQSFQSFSVANQLQAESFDPDGVRRKRYRDMLDRCIDYYSIVRDTQGVDSPRIDTPRWQVTRVSMSEAGHEKKWEPVFLVGFPRSGTTLLDKIIDSHPQAQVLEERHLVTDLITSLPDGVEGYPANLASLRQDDIDSLRKAYFDRLQQYFPPETKGLLIDKFPLNIAYLGFIDLLFPKAKIILAQRHPLDVCLSNFMQKFTLNDAMANFLTLEDTVSTYQKIFQLQSLYVSNLSATVYKVSYESVVGEFEATIKGLLDFLGLPWDDCVRHYNRVEQGNSGGASVSQTPSYQAVRQDIYTHARYRWVRYQQQLAPIMSELSSITQSMGYSSR